MSIKKIGIYEILCLVSLKSYVGSSCNIYRRWGQHRTLLRRGLHRSPRLQQAWNKHGESNFYFSVLEECSRDELFVREQFHIDSKKRDYNSMPVVRVITKEMRRKMVISAALLAAARTHCPHGHEYTPDNCYYGKKAGDKRCKACNRERVARVYANETPEQKRKRLDTGTAWRIANRQATNKRMQEYMKNTKEQKRAYDLAYRPIKNAKRREQAKINGGWHKRRSPINEVRC
mgnify:CR=1 FL=1